MNEGIDVELLNALWHKRADNSPGPEWQVLKSTAIYRKHAGDIEGAIEVMVKAISLTRGVPKLQERTSISLNYLADLYLLKGATDQAEEAIREAIEFSRPDYPGLLATNLWVLAGIQFQKGAYREALVSAEESLRVYEEQNDAYGVGQANSLIERITSKLD